jgi:hypothetical protein
MWGMSSKGRPLHIAGGIEFLDTLPKSKENCVSFGTSQLCYASQDSTWRQSPLLVKTKNIGGLVSEGRRPAFRKSLRRCLSVVD